MGRGKAGETGGDGYVQSPPIVNNKQGFFLRFKLVFIYRQQHKKKRGRKVRNLEAQIDDSLFLVSLTPFDFALVRLSIMPLSL